MSIIKELLESRGHKILATKMRNMAAANNQSRPDTQSTHTAVAPAADLTKSVKQDDPPFEPDAPKKNPSATAGKFGQGYSTARHLARQGIKTVTKEEVEEIDEISKDTLKSYIGKATKDVGEKKRQQQIAIDRSNQPRYAGKYAQRSALELAGMHADKAMSRAKNIGKAAMKFAEESEVEEQITGSHLNVNHNKYYTSQERIRHRKGTLKAAVAEAVTGRSFHDLRAQMAEQAVAPVEYEYYKGRKLHFAKGNRGGKSSSSRGGPASDAGADAGGNGGSGGGNGN